MLKDQQVAAKGKALLETTKVWGDICSSCVNCYDELKERTLCNTQDTTQGMGGRLCAKFQSQPHSQEHKISRVPPTLRYHRLDQNADSPQADWEIFVIR